MMHDGSEQASGKNRRAERRAPWWSIGRLRWTAGALAVISLVPAAGAVVRWHEQGWAGLQGVEAAALAGVAALALVLFVGLGRIRPVPRAPTSADDGARAADAGDLEDAQRRLSESLSRQKELADRERALRREIDHRVRNNLAALLGLIRLYTRSGDPDAFSKIEGKVRAMSEAHDILAGSDGRDAEIAPIVRRLAVLILGDAGARRVRVESVTGAIPPAQASALAMIVQELLTNSLKHGAMRTGADPAGAGHISVRWRPSDDGPGFTFRWREHAAGPGGPSGFGASVGPGSSPAASCAGEGLGLELIRGLARSELQGRCEFAFGPDGLGFDLFSPVCLFDRESEPILSISRS